MKTGSLTSSRVVRSRLGTGLAVLGGILLLLAAYFLYWWWDPAGRGEFDAIGGIFGVPAALLGAGALAVGIRLRRPA